MSSKCHLHPSVQRHVSSILLDLEFVFSQQIYDALVFMRTLICIHYFYLSFFSSDPSLSLSLLLFSSLCLFLFLFPLSRSFSIRLLPYSAFEHQGIIQILCFFACVNCPCAPWGENNGRPGRPGDQAAYILAVRLPQCSSAVLDSPSRCIQSSIGAYAGHRRLMDEF